MRKLLCLAGALVLCATQALAEDAPIPRDRDQFTTYVSQQFSKSLPGYSVTVKGPLEIHLTGPGKFEFTAFLDRIFDFCTRQPDQCAVTISEFVVGMSKMPAPSSDVHADIASLRAVVRPSVYLAGTQKMIGDDPDKRLVSRPLVGDVVELCVIDQPTTAAVLNSAKAREMGFADDAAALAQCEKNIAVLYPDPTIADKDAATGSVGKATVIIGDYYQSSRLLLRNGWNAVAAKNNGQLLIAVPEANTFIWSTDTSADGIGVMSRLVDHGIQSAEKPISAEIFKWTPQGWDVVAQ